jgi:hypothetical protein
MTEENEILINDFADLKQTVEEMHKKQEQDRIMIKEMYQVIMKLNK